MVYTSIQARVARHGVPIMAALVGCMVSATPSFASVAPGDTFSFDISGFNSAGTTGYLLTPDETSVFGTTQTYTGAGINGQDITISSSEVIGATATTDTFKVSTPTNFLTTTKVNGTTISQLQFDLGDANSGSNQIHFLLPVSGITGTGTAFYGSNNIALTPTITLSSDGLYANGVEGVNTGTSAISSFAVHEFDLVLTYANPAAAAVPEPASWALMISGFGLVGGALRRRQTVSFAA